MHRIPDERQQKQPGFLYNGLIGGLLCVTEPPPQVEFEEVLEKLAGMYKRKSKCEIKGAQYRTSDFVFKVGTVTDQKGSKRGLLLEMS